MPDLNSLIQESTAFQITFNLFGGTALLMYGVDFMGGGLEKASGKVMKKILSVLTNLYGFLWAQYYILYKAVRQLLL